MKSNGVVGALVIVVVGGVMAACTSQAVGDGKSFGVADGKATSQQAVDGDKTPTSPGTTPAPGGATTSTPAAPPAPPPGPGSCSYRLGGSSACDTCANAKCCDVLNACASNAQCSDLDACLGSCNGDSTCRSSCYQEHQGGAALHYKAVQCLQGTCGSSCS